VAKKKKTNAKKKFNPYMWILGIVVGLFLLNVIVGVVRKPAHLLTPITKYFYKVPSQTWDSYQGIFETYETQTLDASFLAALAQAESAGNPIATPYWEFTFQQDILSFFRPASSSLGLYQMTYDTFQDAKRFCFVDGRIAVDAKKSDLKNCWQNDFKFRFSASDSVHLTSARLSYYTESSLRKQGVKASRLQRQQTAAIIQLCGPGKAQEFIRSGFNVKKMGACGSHSVSAYIKRVFSYKKTFMAMR
jgi:hypothetical protein